MANNQGNSFYMGNIRKGHYILLVILVLATFSCNKETEYIPGQGIQGIREPIFRILLSPVAYDAAIVVVEGVVRDYSEQKGTDSADTDEIETRFKLYDTRGNYINVTMPGSWEIADNDYLIVGGMYRKNPNEIEAKQFEKVDFEDKDEGDIDKEKEKRDDW